MTRKKFVKQLMAMGYQRNNAEALAVWARSRGWTYEQYLKVERQCNRQFTALKNAASKIAAIIKPDLDSFTASVKELAHRATVAFSSVVWDTQYGKEVLRFLAGNQEENPLPQWPKENPHRCDAVDALTYIARGGGGHD